LSADLSRPRILIIIMVSNNPNDNYGTNNPILYPFSHGELLFPPTQDHAELLSDPHWALTIPDPSHLQVTPPTAPTPTTQPMVVQHSSEIRIPQLRHRKKDHGDSEPFRLVVASLDEVGQRAVNDYGGTTAEGRAWLLHSWKTYQANHPQSLPPIIRKGPLGPRQGGGEMECTICGKTSKTLQRTMAHLFDHWKMSLFYCGLNNW
jgi:hypothetical protein